MKPHELPEGEWCRRINLASAWIYSEWENWQEEAGRAATAAQDEIAYFEVMTERIDRILHEMVFSDSFSCHSMEASE